MMQSFKAVLVTFFFLQSRRRHTISLCDWSSDVCSSDLVEAGLSARDAARLKVRQPLASIALPGEPLPEDVAQIVREELNVKALTFGAPEVKLDTEITEELKLEGFGREVVRAIQERRKKLGFNVEDRIHTRYEADGMLDRAIGRHADYIKNETLSVTLEKGRADDFDGEQMMIEG